MDRALTSIGAAGAGIGILCCFTPLLPIALTGIGAAGLIDVVYRDAVLLPFVGFSILLLGTGLWLIHKSR